MEPLTTLGSGTSSLAPWPNASSLVPLALSVWRTRLGALAQSLLPAVLTVRLPSLLSNVLPVTAPPGEASATNEPRVTTANTTAAMR